MTEKNNELCPNLPTDKKFDPSPTHLHACMGLNECAQQNVFGTNKCCGQGLCSTAVPHVCKTMNECRGQGGCGLFGSASEQCFPGENSCKYQGTCGTPIQAERFSTNGPNMGLSTWVLARKRFEDRMLAKDKNPGDSPCQYGPPEQWLFATYKFNGYASYDSCGASGDKRCSFGYNDPTRSTKELVRRSKDRLEDVVKDCDCD